ncbi:hypothetical protein KSC_022180 [Ktedonobacter sp. SOSP1-52]|uniref:hypothetical protein n=1 Tax=Ktedonobacter sp. SOSP1-52 TaxID=2778366 RepID=UPI001915304C|nr:hypothetical protein [Ktedonobacter sp. SOSP1-52]GHO63326.1 hypothetical protein KSC_022180 [Ktedonobacter sp. SOSP1-52]
MKWMTRQHELDALSWPIKKLADQENVWMMLLLCAMFRQIQEEEASAVSHTTKSGSPDGIGYAPQRAREGKA